jgi:selenide,water dikinase
VTGFGLLGHLWEMASRSEVAVEVEAAAVPLLEGARECSALGVHTGGEVRNREWAGQHVEFGPNVDTDVAALLFDPQTSGGLLIGVPARRTAAFEGAFIRDGATVWRIGRVRRGVAAIRVV